MKKFLFETTLLITFLLAACGDDSSSLTEPAPESSAAEQVVPEQSSSSRPSLDSCSVEGDFSWNEAGKSYFRCENGLMQPHEVVAHSPGFDACQFNFGAQWQHAHEDSAFYAGLDYIAVWLGDNAYYNEFEKRMVRQCMKIGATPMIYAYVIAEFGKDHGFVDCDVAGTGKSSLCTDGANLIREFFADSVIQRYVAYAKGMARQLNSYEVDLKTYRTIWLIEPDFYQYSETGSRQKEEHYGIAQKDGGIPDSMMGVYFKQIVDSIHAYLPAAEIAIDISPWISDWKKTSQESWYSNFDMSIVDYASTSGGRTLAASDKIRGGNKATWKEIYDVVKKPILADAGYGAGGAGEGHDKKWDLATNIKKRMADGVIGVMQMDADRGFPAVADTVRPQLDYKYPWCESKQK